MATFRINDWDYLDIGGGDSGSDKDGESSDDDLEVMLHGTPEQKRKLRQRIDKLPESDDEFVTEMENELEQKVRNLESYRNIDIADAVSQHSRQPVDVDDPYAGEDSDDDVLIGPKLSNDDLLYDPDMDDDDQMWIDSQRCRNAAKKNKLGLNGNKRSVAACNSDAILDCPACLTTLCIDCQRHTTYQNQYRAMFVMNCSTDGSEVLSFPESSKKRKNNRAYKSLCSTDSSIRHPESDVFSMNVDQDETGKANTSPCDNLDVKQSTSSQVVNVDSKDVFHRVRCSECNTAVAVVDTDEVYHFFNVIAAYT